VGGYEDWLRQRSDAAAIEPPPVASHQKAPLSSEAAAGSSRKLSYREQQELRQLPGHIEALEGEQRHLNDAMERGDFYKEPADTIKQTLARIEAGRKALAALYARWDELDSRSKA
jgi:ABC transport system ATP-binding/permease protein